MGCNRLSTGSTGGMSDAGTLDEVGEQVPPAVTLGGTGLGAHSGGEIAAALFARPPGAQHMHLHAASKAAGASREGGEANLLEEGGGGERIGLGVGGSVVGKGVDRAAEPASARSVQAEEAAATAAAMQGSRRLPTPIPPSPPSSQWSSSRR